MKNYDRLWTRDLNNLAWKAKFTLAEAMAFLQILSITDSNGVLEIPMEPDLFSPGKLKVDVEHISHVCGWDSNECQKAFGSVFTTLLETKQLIPFTWEGDDKLYGLIPSFLASQSKLPKARLASPPFVEFTGDERHPKYELNKHSLGQYLSKANTNELSFELPLILDSQLIKPNKALGDGVDKNFRVPPCTSTSTQHNTKQPNTNQNISNFEIYLWELEKQKGIQSAILSKYSESDYQPGDEGNETWQIVIDKHWNDFKKTEQYNEN